MSFTTDYLMDSVRAECFDITTDSLDFSNNDQIQECIGSEITTLSREDDPSFIAGIARDGHLVKIPYNIRGETWKCSDYDVCNGRFFEDGSYAYITKNLQAS